MPVVEYGSLKINVDEEGYLVNPEEWNEKVACALAEQQGVEELTPQRMAIIKFLRDYYREYNYFPILNAVCLNVHQPKQCMKEQFMHPLQAWKIAGLPKPAQTVLAYLNYGQIPT